MGRLPDVNPALDTFSPPVRPARGGVASCLMCHASLGTRTGPWPRPPRPLVPVTWIHGSACVPGRTIFGFAPHSSLFFTDYQHRRLVRKAAAEIACSWFCPSFLNQPPQPGARCPSWLKRPLPLRQRDFSNNWPGSLCASWLLETVLRKRTPFAPILRSAVNATGPAAPPRFHDLPQCPANAAPWRLLFCSVPRGRPPLRVEDDLSRRASPRHPPARLGPQTRRHHLPLPGRICRRRRPDHFLPLPVLAVRQRQPGQLGEVLDAGLIFSGRQAKTAAHHTAVPGGGAGILQPQYRTCRRLSYMKVRQGPTAARLSQRSPGPAGSTFKRRRGRTSLRKPALMPSFPGGKTEELLTPAWPTCVWPWTATTLTFGPVPYRPDG